MRGEEVLCRCETFSRKIFSLLGKWNFRRKEIHRDLKSEEGDLEFRRRNRSETEIQKKKRRRKGKKIDDRSYWAYGWAFTVSYLCLPFTCFYALFRWAEVKVNVLDEDHEPKLTIKTVYS